MTLKPTSTYKMPKALKMRLANILDPHYRGVIARSYIQAHLESQIVERKTKNSKSQKIDNSEE
jgi:hypothetical protein